MSTFMRVDLPAPFSPTTAWTVPNFTAKLTFESAFTPGNVLLMPRMSRAQSATTVISGLVLPGKRPGAPRRGFIGHIKRMAGPSNRPRKPSRKPRLRPPKRFRRDVDNRDGRHYCTNITVLASWFSEAFDKGGDRFAHACIPVGILI
ncbi:hypothetical protein MPLDJ20_20514 [Mesorhizobium plurifarium]|uniref:Uncharacterized protein n=1 Tax=Mesorhizobium plurifarium TaxID=69974 RepID=A0A090F3V6_MESPL|nr:hypothetical protein MPLDJ20_20514 [Mesorhizobium plurifarium]